jgi:hypothetical protein
MITSRISKQGLLAVPGVVLGVFPNLFCPACWPAYTGLLASVGIPFIPTAAYLFPVTTAFLVVSTVALAFRAQQRRRYGPFLLGAVGSVAVLTGRFTFDMPMLTYVGLGSVIAASLWNSLPRNRPASPASCSQCASETKTG